MNVIGDIPEHIAPRTFVDARIALDALVMNAATTALADIHRALR